MRLALFTDSNIAYIDGAGRIIRELIRYVTSHTEHRLLVFHRSDGEENAQRPSDNVTVYSVAAPYLHVPTYDAYPLVYLRSPRKRLLRLAREFQPNTILTISPYLPGGIGRSALFVADQLRIPLVGSFDLHLLLVSERYGRTVFKSGLAVRLWLTCASRLMRSYQKCTKILVPSRFIWQHAEQRYGTGRCLMFPRGVDSAAFSPAHRDDSFKAQHGISGKVTILYTGRISVEKNLNVLLDVYARLRAQNRDVALALVGEGPERKQIEAPGIPDVIFTGILRGDQLSRAYASADLFAFPSRVDAGPMVIVEALASGLPVVVSNQGGAQDSVIHGETGFVAKDTPEFAAYVDLLVRDSQLRLAMGANARRYAEGQSWQRIFDDLLAALPTQR